MFNFIMAATMFLILIIVFASYQSAANVRGNMRMSVTLLKEYVNHPEVLAIIQNYKKYNRLLLLLFAVAALPIYIISYTSFVILYLTLWIFAVFVVSNHLFNQYNAKIFLLKSKNLWFPEDRDYDSVTREDILKGRGKWELLLRKYVPTTLDRILLQSGGTIYADEDLYWINGYYYNPNDKTTMVDKRVGIGSTMNMATKSGKIMSYVTVVFITIVVVPIIALFLWMDFATFQMKIGDNKVSINAPMYDYEFNISDALDITLSNTLPQHGARTNGAATDQYYLGHYRFDEYGDSMVYLYPEYPPYLIIKLPNKTVMFNAKSAEKTKAYYEELTNRRGSK